VYRLTQGIVPRSNDTLIGAPGTILNGSKLVGSFNQANGLFVATGQTQRNPEVTGQCAPSTYQGCQYADAVFFDDRPLVPVSRKEAVAPARYSAESLGRVKGSLRR